MNIEAQVEVITAKQHIKKYMQQAFDNALNEAEALAILEGLIDKEAFPLMKLWAQEAAKEIWPVKKV